MVEKLEYGMSKHSQRSQHYIHTVTDGLKKKITLNSFYENI